MGRSKRGFLDRGEQKKIKAGSLSLINHSEPKQTNYLSRFLVGRHRVAPEYFTNARHAVVDTRRPAKSNESYTRPGAYDRATAVRHLDDYADRDTELYAAAVQLYEERLAAARQGEACI